MDAQSINRTYDLFTLAMGDTNQKLKRYGAFYIGPCPFCGGRDRFNLKHTHQGWRWYCRKCGGEKYNTAIDYKMRRDNEDFKQALKSLGGNIQLRPIAPVESAEPESLLPDPDLQKKLWRRVDVSFSYLKSIAGRSGMRVLTERALSKATRYIYLLGMDPNKFDIITKRKRPAIVIPWFDSGPDGEIITAIKYRFIDDLARDPKHRYTSIGKPIVFGLHAAAGHDVLILVEGEINAMSIVQVSARDFLHIDAISFGGETQVRADVLRQVAKDYRRVMVWADDAEKAKKIRTGLNLIAASALCSPEIDGHKYDANALLQKDWLSDFLREAVKFRFD
jgi:hypothetical protein